MAQSTVAYVEPSVLRWARVSVGLTPLAASRKIGLPDTRVEEWESGTIKPTIAQLRKAAEVYHRPLGVFFLPEPPQDFDAMRDFRRHIGAAASEWSPELHAEYRRASEQREYALELAELDDSPPTTAWRLDPLPDEEAIAAKARATLLGVGPLPVPRAGTKYDHLNAWIAALEEAGVLVLATSRGRVSPDEMRAFSLYFDVLPVIVVNGADAPRGRLFSAVHEYAHLILHTGGVCDTVTDLAAVSPDRRLEARCNAIAAGVLMPADQVLSAVAAIDHDGHETTWDYTTLREAAAPFGVSAEAFLRRLLTLERVSPSFYQAKRDEFRRAYEQEEGAEPASGGNWYRNKVRDLGKGYVRQVSDAYRRRVIDSYTAASFLDAKVDQIGRLSEAATLSEPT